MIDNIYYEHSALEIPRIFSEYHQNYQHYIESEKGKGKVLELIESVLESKEEEIINEFEDVVDNIDEIEQLYNNLYSTEVDLMNQLLPGIKLNNLFNFSMDTEFWEDKINRNIRENEDRENEDSYEEDFYNQKNTDDFISEEDYIDDLFEK